MYIKLNTTRCIEQCKWFSVSSTNFNKYIVKKNIRIARLLYKDILMDSPILSPPKSVRGMIELDRNKFTKHVKIPHLKLENVNPSSVIPYIKKYLLKMENLKPVQTSANVDEIDFEKKIALLNPCIVKNWSDLEIADRENLIALGISEKQFKVEDFALKYENWRADEILKSILPADKDSLSSFSKIGHIVHVNLKDYLLPYKTLIGNVLLDKVKSCRTVVNKIDVIDSAYRFFKMEILSGENDMQCRVKENHCLFEFDFSTVYWNPRLCTEHERITQMLKENDILYDVFAGVGPFSIPAAKKKTIVFANDLNPESYKWLKHNAKLNKIKPDYLKTFNKDGREFILNDLKNDLIERMKSKCLNNKVHITMNLPASAIEFLDVFYGIFDVNTTESFESMVNPIVHVYCFVKGDDPQKIALENVELYLGVHLGKRLHEVFYVRNVSPKKDMMRVSFELTCDILYGTTPRKRKHIEDSTTDPKKCCHGKKERKQDEHIIQSSECKESQTKEES